MNTTATMVSNTCDVIIHIFIPAELVASVLQKMENTCKFSIFVWTQYTCTSISSIFNNTKAFV